MLTSISINFFYSFCQGRKVLQGPFIKINVTKPSFHLVTYDIWIKTVHILSTQKSVATNLNKLVLFEAVLSDIS